MVAAFSIMDAMQKISQLSQAVEEVPRRKKLGSRGSAQERYIVEVSPALNIEQLALVSRCLARCESMVAHFYRIPALPSHTYPYEVATTMELEPHERADDAFAHLVVYARKRTSSMEVLYRICLQDQVILNRLTDELQRHDHPTRGAAAQDWLKALLIYILTHELVHVVRFQRAEESFLADQRDRRQEEERVHQITLDLLGQAGERSWERLNDLIGNPVIPARRVVR